MREKKKEIKKTVFIIKKKGILYENWMDLRLCNLIN